MVIAALENHYRLQVYLMKLKKRRKILNNRNKSVTKSIILKKLADSYPGFLKKDLEKILSITLDEMRNALKGILGLS